LSLSAPSASPTESPAEVVVEATEKTNIEAVITVWPYNVSPSGLVDLPQEGCGRGWDRRQEWRAPL